MYPLVASNSLILLLSEMNWRSIKSYLIIFGQACFIGFCQSRCPGHIIEQLACFFDWLAGDLDGKQITH
jgi:hypothetical protein